MSFRDFAVLRRIPVRLRADAAYGYRAARRMDSIGRPGEHAPSAGFDTDELAVLDPGPFEGGSGEAGDSVPVEQDEAAPFHRDYLGLPRSLRKLYDAWGMWDA